MLPPNKTLGRYEIIREVARSNDVVYEAWDPLVQRRVALKELLIPSGAPRSLVEERMTRFRREAAAAGSLSHPNIATIYDHGIDGGRVFIAMEFLSAPTLGEIINQRAPMEAKECIHVLSGLLRALECAHGQHIVHRDIKPHNIFLLTDGTLKLADFGIAKLAHEPTITLRDTLMGTPHYMSPEQAGGADVDGRTDLWAAGVILFEMATGLRPFAGPNALAILESVRRDEPNFAAIRDTRIRQLAKELLAKAPSQRIQSADAVLARLSILDGPVQAKPHQHSAPSSQSPAGQIIQRPVPVVQQYQTLPTKSIFANNSHVRWVIGLVGFFLLLWALSANTARQPQIYPQNPQATQPSASHDPLPPPIRSEAVPRDLPGADVGTTPPDGKPKLSPETANEIPQQSTSSASAPVRLREPRAQVHKENVDPRQEPVDQINRPAFQRKPQESVVIQPTSQKKVPPDPVDDAPPIVGDSRPSAVKAPPP